MLKSPFRGDAINNDLVYVAWLCKSVPFIKLFFRSPIADLTFEADIIFTVKAWTAMFQQILKCGFIVRNVYSGFSAIMTIFLFFFWYL